MIQPQVIHDYIRQPAAWRGYRPRGYKDVACWFQSERLIFNDMGRRWPGRMHAPYVGPNNSMLKKNNASEILARDPSGNAYRIHRISSTIAMLSI